MESDHSEDSSNILITLYELGCICNDFNHHNCNCTAAQELGCEHCQVYNEGDGNYLAENPLRVWSEITGEERDNQTTTTDTGDNTGTNDKSIEPIVYDVESPELIQPSQRMSDSDSTPINKDNGRKRKHTNNDKQRKQSKLQKDLGNHIDRKKLVCREHPTEHQWGEIDDIRSDGDERQLDTGHTSGDNARQKSLPDKNNGGCTRGELTNTREEMDSDNILVGNSDGESSSEDTNIYYWTVIHTDRDINKKKTGNTPTFILADHRAGTTKEEGGCIESGGHFHILWKGSTGGVNRSITRISKFLQLSSGEIMQLKSKRQKIQDIHLAIAYLCRYGVNKIQIYGNLPHLLKMIEDITDEKILLTIQKSMNEKREARIPEKAKKGKNQMRDVMIKLIKDKTIAPYSITKLMPKITLDEHGTLWNWFGPGWKTNIIDLMGILNMEYKITKSGDYKTIVENNVTLNENKEVNEWLDKFFIQQGINPKKFFKDFQDIFNQKHIKINCLMIEGPTNAFKTTMLRLLLDGMNYTPMTRNAEGNTFYLQSCLTQDMIVWEEPTITPNTVNDWKLLLGGEPIKVSIKNQPDEIMERKPFFITSNNNPQKWISEENWQALQERIIHYKFTAQIQSRNNISRQICQPPYMKQCNLIQYFLSK